jgi:hypothetical protein
MANPSTAITTNDIALNTPFVALRESPFRSHLRKG